MVPTFSTALLFQGYGIKEATGSSIPGDELRANGFSGSDSRDAGARTGASRSGGLGNGGSGNGGFEHQVSRNGDDAAPVPAHPLTGRRGREGAGTVSRW
jgi:hypothetical protein